MIYCTAINCIDGRAQLPVIRFLTRRMGVRYVDMITEPGAVRVLAEQKDAAAVEAILRGVRASIHHHESRTIVIVAHHDCKANPVEPPEQHEHMKSAIEHLKHRFPEVTMLGLWVDERGKASVIPDTMRDRNL